MRTIVRFLKDFEYNLADDKTWKWDEHGAELDRKIKKNECFIVEKTNGKYKLINSTIYIPNDFITEDIYGKL